jgi:hypothetical protein
MSTELIMPEKGKGDETTELSKELTDKEKSALDKCEKRILAWGEETIMLGKALLEIKDSRLYRQDFSTFDDYCRLRWGFVDQTAYNAIKKFENIHCLTHDARVEVKPDPEAPSLKFLEKIKDPEKKIELYGKIVDKSKEAKKLEKTSAGVIPDAKIAEETVNRSLAAEKSAADRARKNSKAGKAEGNGHAVKPKTFKDELKEMDKLLGAVARLADKIENGAELESSHAEHVRSSCQVAKNWVEKWRNALKG